MSGTFRELNEDGIVTMYKIILADEWQHLSEKERRDYIRRMMYAKYGAYDSEDMFNVFLKMKTTDIYKWAEDEGVFDESHVDRLGPRQSGTQSSNQVHETNLGSRAMSLLRAAYQRTRRAIALR
jgi:hypothetical protein